MAIFNPDSSVVRDIKPSPNFNMRKNERDPDMIVLHYTGMADSESALSRLCTVGSEVSAHYVVPEDGHIVQCVPEAQRAWHAGASSWAGETDINSASVGIEIVNRGHDLGYPDFPLRQIAAVIALCRSIIMRHEIQAWRVLAHSDVAPGRKKDPGEKFPWRLLSDSGIGHWVEPVAIADGDSNLLDIGGDGVISLQRALATYGYGIVPSGEYDSTTMDTVIAFQRHFRPARVDGVADASTLATLGLLLRELPIAPLAIS